MTLLPNRAGDTERLILRRIQVARMEAFIEAAEYTRTQADIMRHFGNDAGAAHLDKVAEWLRGKAEGK